MEIEKKGDKIASLSTFECHIIDLVKLLRQSSISKRKYKHKIERLNDYFFPLQ